MKCKKNTKIKCLKCGKEKEVDFTYCLGNRGLNAVDIL